jgi:hypothetical protein
MLGHKINDNLPNLFDLDALIVTQYITHTVWRRVTKELLAPTNHRIQDEWVLFTMLHESKGDQ